VATEKKELERFYLDRFLTLLTPSLTGAIEATEEPDFLITGDHGCTGIEITELHRVHSGKGRPPQADQAMRKRVIGRAKELYEQAGHPPVHVSVFFNEHFPVQKNRVEEMAQAIVNLAVKNRPALGGSTQEQYDWENRDYFPEDLHQISVHSFPTINRAFFAAPGATWVSHLTPEDVQRVLDAKEAKYAAYTARCDAAWLVINCDGPLMSTWFEFEAAAISGTFRSSFDRAFIVRHFAAKVHELRVRNTQRR